MFSRWPLPMVRAAVLIAAGVFAAACGDNDDDDGGTTPPPPAAENVLATGDYKLEIQSVDMSGAAPVVTFRATKEGGAPIDDLQAQMKNAPAGGAAATGFPYIGAPRFTLARLEPSLDYHAYYVSAAPASQPTSVTMPSADADWASRVQALGNGVYKFTLTALDPAPTAEEKARTHTAGVWGSRVLVSGGEPQMATSTLNFVPGGGTPSQRQVATNAACSRCHAPAVAAHGGQRLGVQLCLTCHTSQLSDTTAATTPAAAATGNSIEMKTMIHRIHYGGDLPGEPYKIASNFAPATSPEPGYFVFDASFINDVRNCALCHQGADAGRSLTAVTETNCKTCHATVDFTGGASALCQNDLPDSDECNHVPTGQQACTVCHGQDVLAAAHTSIFETAKAFKYEIMDVTVAGDRKPTARVRVLDAATNQPRDLANDPAYKQTGSSLNVQFGWPSKEYTNDGAQAAATAPSPGQPLSVPVVRAGALQTTNVAAVSGQTGVYDVTAPLALPDGVTSAAAFMDGHPVVKGENVPVQNELKAFGVGGAAQERRQVVDVQKCDQCHGMVNAHGRNRSNNPAVCAVCHNPKATDWRRRQGVASGEQTVDFKNLVHGIHSLRMRQTDLVYYGFNGANAATGGNPGREVRFATNEEGIPTTFNDCTICHSAESWKLPLNADVLPTTVTDTKGTPTDQTDDTGIISVRAVCSGCHDAVDFDNATLPVCNTLPRVNGEPCKHSGGTGFGGADNATCYGCHQTGASADITKYHVQP